MSPVEQARLGRKIFPLLVNDKRPFVEQWEQRAISDPDQVARFWPSPRHNIGIACGPSGLVVVDLDMPKPDKPIPPEWLARGGIREGADVFACLAEDHGDPHWPATYSVMTPSKGIHLYYLAPEGREIRNSAGKVGPMVDIRASGGYVVAAGSVVDGKQYTVLDDSDPLPLPTWLADLADPPRRATPAPAAQSRRAVGGERPRSRFVGLLDTLLTAPNGQRNCVLHWCACRASEMVRDGQVTQQAAYDALTNAAVSIGLSDREVQRTIDSAFRGAA